MVLEEGSTQNQPEKEWIPEVMSTGGASSSSANVHFMLINCFQIAGGSATGKALSNCPAFVWLVFWQSAPPPSHAQVEFMSLTVVVAVVGALKGCMYHALCTHHLLPLSSVIG